MPDVFLFEIYGYDDALAEFWQKKRPPEGDPNHTKQLLETLFSAKKPKSTNLILLRHSQKVSNNARIPFVFYINLTKCVFATI